MALPGATSIAWNPMGAGQGSPVSIPHSSLSILSCSSDPWFIALAAGLYWAVHWSMGWKVRTNPASMSLNRSRAGWVDAFLKLTCTICLDRTPPAKAESSSHLELPWDNCPHLLFRDGKKSPPSSRQLQQRNVQE